MGRTNSQLSGGGKSLGYTVTFKVSGNDYYIASCEVGGKIEEPPKPSAPTGKGFYNWLDSNDNPITFPFVPSADVELNANFVDFIVLDYIGSTTTQFIDTGYTPNANTTIKVTVSDIQKQSGKSIGIILAATATWISNSFDLVHQSTYFRWLSGNNVYFGDNIASQKNVIEIYQNQVTLNGVQLTPPTGYNYGTVTTIKLFRAPYITDVEIGYSILKMHGFEIWENGTLLKKFIPVYDTRVSKAGMYEEISGQMYYNADTTSSDFDFVLPN